MRFFFYGTLMDRDVLSCLLEQPQPDARFVPALLTGYRRARAQKRHFPMLAASANGSVEGYLVSGLDETAALRLAWHEHVGYDIVQTRPVLSYGEPVPAWTFISARGVMEPGLPWSFAAWQRQHKRQTLSRLQRVLRAGKPTPADLAVARIAWSRRRETGA